jgi:hypothetical protein
LVADAVTSVAASATCVLVLRRVKAVVVQDIKGLRKL